jgi:hypothetical protein
MKNKISKKSTVSTYRERYDQRAANNYPGTRSIHVVTQIHFFTRPLTVPPY